MARQSPTTELLRQIRPVLMGAILALQSAIGVCETAEGTPPMTLLAGRVLQPDGRLQKDVAVVVRSGKIKRLGPASKLQGPEVRRFGPNTVLCPGLIGLFSSLAARGQNVETAHFVDPEARAADALDPWDKDLSAALRSGITAAMVAPAAGNLVCGTCVTFRTFVSDGHIDVLRDDGPLVFALGEGVWQRERAPTSRAGTLYELRNLLTRARKGEAHPRINAAVAGRKAALLICKSGQDVTAAHDALGDLTRRFVVVIGSCAVHSDDAIDLAAEAKAFRRPVVVGPYTFTSSRRQLLGAAKLADSGLEVAFRMEDPEPAAPRRTTTMQALRITAALAVRHGMAPAAARRAMTINAAKVAGVAGRLGAIAPNKDADLVVFSQDPLRPDAKVLDVYVRGVRVHCAANQDISPAGGRQCHYQ